jgi:hypothetical protein
VATAVASQSYSALGGLTIPYAKHSTLGAAFERRETLFPQRRDVDMSMSGMRGWWTRQVNRDLGIKLGYSRERAHLSGGDEYVYETFDAGINAVRPLSRDRRTTLSFRMETARVETPLFGRHYRLNGGVNLSSWVKRTWMFGARIDRATDFVAGFAEPLHSDTVGATLSGLLSRRAELQVQVDGGRGKFGFSSGVGQFAVGTGMTQFSYAVSRTIGVFVQHALFYYELPQSASLVAPVSYLARQTVTVGMTTWIPIYTRERSPSDTR